MKNPILIATVIAVATGALVAPVSAKSKDGFRPGKMSFEQLDLDGNGVLSTEELQSRGEARFTAMDSDGDGLLTGEELIAYHQERMEQKTAKMIERFDKDGDGALSSDELPQRRGSNKIMEKADTNGDGEISKAEFDTAQAIIKAVMHKMKRGGKRHKGGDHGHMMPNADQN